MDVLTTDQVRTALDRARATISAADYEVKTMAALIAGRLRNANVSHMFLKELKQELQKYNIHTRRWRG